MSFNIIIMTYTIGIILSLTLSYTFSFILMMIIMITNLTIILLNEIICIYIHTYNILFLTIYENDENYYYNDDNICPICCENKIDRCCDPCGHTYCDKCIKKSYYCYICKRYINKTIKIYI